MSSAIMVWYIAAAVYEKNTLRTAQTDINCVVKSTM